MTDINEIKLTKKIKRSWEMAYIDRCKKTKPLTEEELKQHSDNIKIILNGYKGYLKC